MNLIYIYSQHDASQLRLLDRIKEELPSYAKEIAVMEVDEAKKLFHVRATPALIPVLDSLQGEFLLQEDVQGELLLIAKAYQLMDMEEREFLNVDNARLDTFVVGENNEAIDDTMMDMILGGLI